MNEIKSESEHIRSNLPELDVNLFCDLELIDSAKYLGFHFHREIELVKVKTGRIRCGFADKTEWISEGDLLIVNSNTVHRLIPGPERSVCDLIQLDASNYLAEKEPQTEKYLSAFVNINFASPYMLVKKGEHTEVSDAIDRMIREYKTKGVAYDLYIRSCIYGILAFLRRYRLLVDLHEIADVTKLEKIADVIEYINTNSEKKLSLDMISGESYINKYYLCRLFKNTVGTTVGEYINYVRMRKAEEMLSTTSKSVTDIALSTGFSSVQYLGRLFRHYRGCSPTEFRKRKTNRY